MAHSLLVKIMQYLSDDPQPGIVSFELIDSDGRRHTFIDKTAIVGLDLDAKSEYPQTGTVACEIVARWNDLSGRELVRVNTSRPWGIESTEGVSEFVVLATQLS